MKNPVLDEKVELVLTFRSCYTVKEINSFLLIS